MSDGSDRKAQLDEAARADGTAKGKEAAKNFWELELASFGGGHHSFTPTPRQVSESEAPSEFQEVIRATEELYDARPKWVEAYNAALADGLRPDSPEAGGGDVPYRAGVDAGKKARKDPKYASYGNPGMEHNFPIVDPPEHYKSHAADWQRGFGDGFTEGAPERPQAQEAHEPANVDEAREQAELYIHLLREAGEKLDESVKMAYESRWGESFPTPALRLGERRAEGEAVPEAEIEEREREAE